MQLWQLLGDKFVKLSQREKWLITLCGFVAIVMALMTFVIEPLYQSNQKVMKNISTTKLASQKLEADVLLMTAKLKKDPDQEINLKYKRLVTESQQLSQQLAQIIENLISPSEMATLLESVLAETKGLQLISLESLGAEPILKNQTNAESSAYYVHPVRLELVGGYFAIVKYLETLESLPVKYYWRSFHYKVEEYPDARLVLEVYTLGTREGFIGG